MKSNFDACLAITLSHEGGWADHPKDPGGATMKGVTIGTYAQFKGRKVTKDELRAIPDADLRTIYRRNYWDKVRGDDLPAGLDLVAFDGAVNSGPSRGAKWLQQALGVTADGKIGPATIAASVWLAAQERETVIIGACNARMGFLRGLKTWATFGTGWQRRVDDVRRKALAMVDVPAVTPTPVAASPAPVPAVKPRVNETAETLTRPAPHVNAAPKHFIWRTVSAIIAYLLGGRK